MFVLRVVVGVVVGGVFPQPAATIRSLLTSSAQRRCVVSAFLSQVKGCHLARREGGSWWGGGGGAHVTLDPARANAHYSASSVSRSQLCR